MAVEHLLMCVAVAFLPKVGLFLKKCVKKGEPNDA